MPSSDQTLLGDKGISLSGGQRQRLVSSFPLPNARESPDHLALPHQALARAVYADAPLLLLDDVLRRVQRALVLNSSPGV